MISFFRPFRPALLGLTLLSLCGGRALAQPLPERRTFVGRVTGLRGAPLGGVYVAIRRTDDQVPATFWGARVLTDARGEFALPDAEDGNYYVTVEAEGYTSDENHQWKLSPSSGALNITLQKLSDLRLRLLKPDGTTLNGAPVSLRWHSNNGGTRVLPTNTDGNGVVTVPGLPPAAYDVDLMTRGAGWAKLPGVGVSPDAAVAPTDVKLQPGGTVRVQVRESEDDGSLRALGGATVFITPSTANDAASRAAGTLNVPADAADMALLYQHYDRSGLITREGEGSVELSDLPPGRYLLRPFASGYATPEAQPVEVKPGETTSVDFALKPSSADVKFSPLVLILKGADGKPLADAEWVVQLRFMGGGDNEAALPTPPGVPNGLPQELLGGALRRARSDAEGKITLYPVRQGRWRVNVQTPRDISPHIELPNARALVSPTADPLTLQVGS